MAVAALADGTLLDGASQSAGYHRCIAVLIKTDRVEPASAAIEALRERAIAEGSRSLVAATVWYEAELSLRTGEPADAERLAREALELGHDESAVVAGAVRVLVCALAERVAVDEGHEVLRHTELGGEARRMPGRTGLLHARARLFLAEGRFAEAYADAFEVGIRRARQRRPNAAWDGWRSTAALALAHQGRRPAAAALSETELALATRFGAPVPIARAQIACAVSEPDDRVRRIICEQALRALGDQPATLESVRLRLELGSALARLGHRVQARDALRPALAAADGVGALALAERARRELVATGVRPRRAATEGPAALTPRQRQICELAAAGKGNPAIAAELFLSVKTVETHLAAAYRKLDVRGRSALAVALAA
jgi:DNA-binding CsgD family transcriptional regulator